mgnify:FL=1|jgi:hypothetical protein
MYVDYRIINEKEIEVINDRGEIIKITGLNTGDIKKAILLSNKIEGLDDKITNQSKIMDNLNYEIAETKETRNKEILGTILSIILFAVSIIYAVPIGFLIATGLISVVGLTAITLNIKDIKKYSMSAGKIEENWSINLERSAELKRKLSELMTKIKVEEKRNEKKEELVKAYKEGLKNETDFSLDYDNVKTLKLR